MKYKEGIGSRLFDVFNYLLMILLIIIMLYPFLNVLAVSMSDPQSIAMGKVSWFPRGFNIEGYQLILSSRQTWIAYWNTIVYAFIGTTISLICTSLMAYPLSINNFVAKKFITIYLAITMFFSGGLIPTYLLIRDLGMINTLWVMVIPGAISAWNVIVYRTFFKGISPELRESAYLDGANDITILFKIILPLSKALLATFALFSIVGHWNTWFAALIYLSDENRFPIQMILRRILFIAGPSETHEMAATMISARLVHPRNIQMAVIIVTVAPILCVYPFLQKHFVKGVMIGSIKG